MSVETLKVVLNMLGEIEWSSNTKWQSDRAKDASVLIREAIEQAEKPVGWWNGRESVYFVHEVPDPFDDNNIPLYTAPPPKQQQTEWVGLKDKDLREMCKEFPNMLGLDVAIIAMTAEKKLKEKNASGWQSVENVTEYLDDLRGGADDEKMYTEPELRDAFEAGFLSHKTALNEGCSEIPVEYWFERHMENKLADDYPESTVAVLNEGHSVIAIDDGCYVVMNRKGDGTWGFSSWIFPEALEVLRQLPKL